MRRPRNSKLVRLIKRWRVPFAGLTAALYVVAIVLLVLVFPDVSNLWVSIFVLVGGATASLSTLGDLMVSAEESDRDQQEAGHQP